MTVTVDRPMGSCHPKYKDLYYPVNYGYIAGIPAPDGEEQDELFLRAKRIEIPASITGVGFYRKMGYDCKNGIAELDGEVYRLEKFR